MIKHMQRKQSKPIAQFSRKYSDAITRGPILNSTRNDITSKSDQVPLDTLIKFLFEIVKDFGRVQSDIQKKTPSTFLELVKHYFGEHINMNIQEFAKKSHESESSMSEDE